MKLTTLIIFASLLSLSSRAVGRSKKQLPSEQPCFSPAALPDSQTSFPLVITNKSNKPVTLHLDLRVDYYYTHNTNKTFLPAWQINEQPTIEPDQTITIELKLPLGLHEPYNSIKKNLRGKQGYEKTNILVTGVIGDAYEPKTFFSIKEFIKCKKALDFTWK